MPPLLACPLDPLGKGQPGCRGEGRLNPAGFTTPHGGHGLSMYYLLTKSLPYNIYYIGFTVFLYLVFLRLCLLFLESRKIIVVPVLPVQILPDVINLLYREAYNHTLCAVPLLTYYQSDHNVIVLYFLTDNK
jgi:hypothetical protein